MFPARTGHAKRSVLNAMEVSARCHTEVISVLLQGEQKEDGDRATPRKRDKYRAEVIIQTCQNGVPSLSATSDFLAGECAKLLFELSDIDWRRFGVHPIVGSLHEVSETVEPCPLGEKKTGFDIVGDSTPRRIAFS